MKLIEPLRTAEAEYAAAVKAVKEQQAKLDDATKDVEAKEAAVAQSKISLENAEKSYDVIANVTFDSLLEKPMTDPEFTFLNAYADTYKTALSEKESAEEEYQVASAKVTECEKAYEQAKLYAAKTMADLALAEEAYQQALANSEPSWKNDNRGWWYEYADGSYATGWKSIDGHWYYFDENGWMQTGWVAL